MRFGRALVQQAARQRRGRRLPPPPPGRYLSKRKPGPLVCLEASSGNMQGHPKSHERAQDTGAG